MADAAHLHHVGMPWCQNVQDHELVKKVIGSKQYSEYSMEFRKSCFFEVVGMLETNQCTEASGLFRFVKINALLAQVTVLVKNWQSLRA